MEFTGDGNSSTLPLEWTGAPPETKSYAVIMHHIDPQGLTKWYWTLYNIPANVHSLPKNVAGIGTLGNNSVNHRAGYAPPHSKGPGPKTYILTVYALSAPVQISLPPAEVNRNVLLTAMKDIVLDSAELRLVYDRTAIIDRNGDGCPANQHRIPELKLLTYETFHHAQKISCPFVINAGLVLPRRWRRNDSTRPRNIGGGGRGRRGAEDYALPPELSAFSWLSLVLGRVSDQSVTVNSLAKETIEGFFEYGTSAGNYSVKTGLLNFPASKPVETVFDKLQPNTQYFYRLQFRKPGETNFTARPECRFHTQRAAGSTFTFAIQGDSHPERPQMSEPNLYARTLLNAAADKPDFYICMGDDFSVAPVQEVNFDSVAARYTLQRPFLGLVAQSAPVFLLNGNHEQASLFNFNQTDERHAVAVHAQNARNQFYPTPAPDRFYSGDTETLPSIGLRKDYCAWTWGDALFVILDNYWHSPVQVDSGFHEQDVGGGKGGRGARPRLVGAYARRRAVSLVQAHAGTEQGEI